MQTDAGDQRVLSAVHGVVEQLFVFQRQSDRRKRRRGAVPRGARPFLQLAVVAGRQTVVRRRVEIRAGTRLDGDVAADSVAVRPFGRTERVQGENTLACRSAAPLPRARGVRYR